MRERTGGGVLSGRLKDNDRRWEVELELVKVPVAGGKASYEPTLNRTAPVNRQTPSQFIVQRS